MDNTARTRVRRGAGQSGNRSTSRSSRAGCPCVGRIQSIRVENVLTDTLEPLESVFIGNCHALVKQHPDDDKTIDEWLASNLCRCTGYQEIKEAVKRIFFTNEIGPILRESEKLSRVVFFLV